MENNLYTNTNYSFERDGSKTIIINVSMGANITTFDVPLSEMITIDKHADIYLDLLTTFNCKRSVDSMEDMGFVLSIDQFEIRSVTNRSVISLKDSDLGRSVFIPNDQNIDGTGELNLDVSKTHKGKKLNYICSINPSNINRISGKLTNMVGDSIFSGNGRFVAEFVIIGK